MSNYFHFFANAALGKGLSGSDRIFIEFAKRLSKKSKVTIHVWEEGFQMCARQGLRENKGIKFCIVNTYFWCKLGFFICYLARIFFACLDAIKLKILYPEKTVIYSASEFWMDSLPAVILKIRYPKITWVAAWFQTAPNPLLGFTKGKRKNAYKLSAFYYWIMQLPIKPLICNLASIVLVNNELEKNEFTELNKLGKIVVILGAVNIDAINRYKKKNENLLKIYSAVFQGRFHPQKGVVELIRIWKMVVDQIPNAKLAMIGEGPLINTVKHEITELGLEKNIDLFGYVFDGPKKYKIFSQSKIVLHPAFFDSGGMASAEAMAFGLPCIGFNLDSYKSYYPKGMIKITLGDLKKFADSVVELIKDKDKREIIGKEAYKMIQGNWSWDQRVNQLLKALEK